MINIPALSKGKLLEVYNETITTPVIVQILNLKPLPGKDRYRYKLILFSDVKYQMEYQK